MVKKRKFNILTAEKMPSCTRNDVGIVPNNNQHICFLYLNSRTYSGVVRTRTSYTVIPPSAQSTCPVINAASSDARKYTAAAISSGVPSLISGVSSSSSASDSSSR